MDIKVNFGTEDSSTEGFILDSGEGFSEAQGYGWVTQASLNDESLTPLDLTGNVRGRASNSSEFDSLIHLQYPTGISGPLSEGSNRTAGAWEYNLANGSYLVTVAVGDVGYTDSNHRINVEGKSAIAGFTPTKDDLFAENTLAVDVKDGKLTIDAIGGDNTKLNFVEIVAVDGSIENPTTENPTNANNPADGGNVLEMVSPVGGDAINVNFGTPGASSDSGFTQDTGAGYSEDRGYGWVTQASAGSNSPTAIDLSANARDRNTSPNDSVQDSLIHLQYPTGLENSGTSVTTPAAWEYGLENGEYEVTVGVGDSDYFDSNHVINVEGQSVISDFAPSAGEQAFSTGTATVEVTDGRLTLDAIGGDNTKINYISIDPVSI